MPRTTFRLAQKTADSLVFDIARGLRDAQGMSAESAQQILETAKATFEQLAASAPDNLDATAKSARACSRELGGDPTDARRPR